MNLTTYKISESVLLDHIRTDKFKKARFNIVFKQPADIKTYTAGMLLFPVAMRATEEFPDFASLSRRCDELYGASIGISASTNGGFSFRGLRAGMLNNRYASETELDILDGVMHAMSQIIFAARIDDEDVEIEKTNLTNRRRATRNNSSSYAWSRIKEIMMAGYPGIMSYDEQAEQEAVTGREDIIAYRDHILAHAEVEFFYCGEASAEHVIKLIEKHFSPLLARRDVPRARDVRFRAGKPRYIDEEGEYSQSQLICGFATDTLLSDKDFYAAELANEIYGEGPVSKLFLNVRERKSLCYSCGSGYNEMIGLLTVECGIDAEDRKEAEREIFSQLAELQNGNISDSELEAAKQSLYSDCREAEDHPEDYEEFSRTERAFGGPRTISEYREGIASVTREDIAAAAKKWRLDTVYFLCGTAEEVAE